MLYFSLQRLPLDYFKLVSLFPDLHSQSSPIIKADPDDDIFIHAARASSSQIIVSGDKHLLDTKEIMGIHILTVSEFLRAFEWLSDKGKPKPTKFPRHPRLMKRKGSI